MRGEATSQAQKDLTTEYVKDVVGVKDVKNEMTVPPDPKEPGKKTMGQKIDTVGDKIGDWVKRLMMHPSPAWSK